MTSAEPDTSRHRRHGGMHRASAAARKCQQAAVAASTGIWQERSTNGMGPLHHTGGESVRLGRLASLAEGCNNRHMPWLSPVLLVLVTCLAGVALPAVTQAIWPGTSCVDSGQRRAASARASGVPAAHRLAQAAPAVRCDGTPGANLLPVMSRDGRAAMPPPAVA